MRGILHVLFFAVFLPGELLIWGRALDTVLSASYLTKRLYLNVFFDLPRECFLIAGGLALCCILRAAVELNRNSHACDGLLYGGFPLYMMSLFFYFRLPCAAALGIPLICMAETAVWFACRPAGRPDFLLPADMNVKATIRQRMTAFLQLLALLAAAGLIFQEGYLLWFSFYWTLLLVVLPLFGVLLPKPGQLREYAASAVYALVLCSILYGAGQIFAEGVLLTDFGIITAYIFLELMAALMIRPMLPPVRNMSLIILGLSSLLTTWIMPPVCNPWIVTMSVYVLYLLIDNRRAIWKKLFSRAHFRHSEVHVLSWEEYAAQAWGFGAFLAACLTGPSGLFHVLLGVGAVLAGALIRSWLLNKSSSDHIILQKFPYVPEISILLLTVAAAGFSRDSIMILMSAFAAAACLMRTIWSIGGLIGKYTQDRPSLQVFYIFSNAGICFLLVLLFFMQAPASVLLGSFCILSGIVWIGSASYRRSGENCGLTTGWVLIGVGQFIFISSSEVLLPYPEWSPGAAAVGLVACAALYVYRLFDFRNRRRNPEYEKEK